MEKVNSERNHLLQDWRYAIIGVERRSITLASETRRGDPGGNRTTPCACGPINSTSPRNPRG
jgi:hypothetical protein